MITGKHVSIMITCALLWFVVGGSQAWCTDKPNQQKYLDLLEKEFGTIKPVTEVSRTVSLDELGY